MSLRLSSRLHRTANSIAVPQRAARALRHHRARERALAERARAPQRQAGIRAWLHALLAMMRTQAAARRHTLRTLLQKPSSLRALALRRANGPRRRVNRPRRLGASRGGWFAFGSR